MDPVSAALPQDLRRIFVATLDQGDGLSWLLGPDADDHEGEAGGHLGRHQAEHDLHDQRH